MLRLTVIIAVISFSLGALASTNSCLELYNIKNLISPEGAMMELMGTLPQKSMKADIMSDGNYKWGRTGGMNYSFAGNTFGDVYHIRRFPFSLSSRLNSFSYFKEAITAKVLQNVADYEANKVPTIKKYLGPLSLNTLSGLYQVSQFLVRPSLSVFVQAETKAYKTMYQFIHKTMSTQQLNKIANGTFVLPFDRKLAQRALLSEETFVKIMVEEAIRSEDYAD